MRWHTQTGNITTNMKVEIYFNLPEFSTTEIIQCNCYVDDSDKYRYDMILGRDILTVLGLNLKHSEQFIKANDGPLKGPSKPMIDLGKYKFKYSNTWKLKPKNCL